MHSIRPDANRLPAETGNSPSEQLYALHAPAIFAYVRLYIAAREVAEDIVIDVFLSAFEHSYLLARSAEVQRAWLRKVAYYKIADYYRLQNRRPLVSLEHVAETLYENYARTDSFFYENDQQMIVGLKDNFDIWDVASGKLLYKYHGSTPFSLAGVDGSIVFWSPDGKYLIMLAGTSSAIGNGAMAI